MNARQEQFLRDKQVKSEPRLQEGVYEHCWRPWPASQLSIQGDSTYAVNALNAQCRPHPKHLPIQNIFYEATARSWWNNLMVPRQGVADWLVGTPRRQNQKGG